MVTRQITQKQEDGTEVVVDIGAKAENVETDATRRFVSDTEKSFWNGKADVPRATAVTIPVSGWSSDSTAGYPKYYDISVSGITANDRASITIAQASLAAAKACGMCPSNETLAGKIRIRAARVPTAAITAQYWIDKGKE